MSRTIPGVYPGEAPMARLTEGWASVRVGDGRARAVLDTILARPR